MTGAPVGSTESIQVLRSRDSNLQPLVDKAQCLFTITLRLQGIGYQRRNSCLWLCSLAVPVLAGWVYGFVVLCTAQPSVVLVLKCH